MKTMTVGEFKTHFSDALDAVRQGETIVVCYGRNHQKVAAMVPFSEVRQPEKRTIGLFKGRARVKFAKDFGLDDDGFLRA